MDKQKTATAYVAIVITSIIAIIIGLVMLMEIRAIQVKKEEQMRQELQEALNYRLEREQYIKEYVQVQLKTTDEVTLWFYSYEGFENGWINKYEATVAGKTYDVKATYVDDIVEIEIEEGEMI